MDGKPLEKCSQPSYRKKAPKNIFIFQKKSMEIFKKAGINKNYVKKNGKKTDDTIPIRFIIKL